jgi:hypothetical protein
MTNQTLGISEPVRVDVIVRRLVGHRPRQSNLLPLEVDHLQLVQQQIDILNMKPETMVSQSSVNN